MSKYNTIVENDVVNGEGICVSFFVQGCPHKCPGCFNPETWDFNGGQPYTEHTKFEIIKALNNNNIQRNFSVLGGEPLALENLSMTEEVINAVRHAYPNIKIFLWTGYYLEQLSKDNPNINSILNNVNYIIDGPFIEEEKNLDLRLRGSDNQSIWHKVEGIWTRWDKGD